ncbi:MAG: hypothetical protein ACXVPQ_10960 [Bacteroidia bacterium]
MKRLLFTAAFFLLIGLKICHAQIFLRAYNYRPTGNFGFVFKPTFSAELGYIQEFEDDRIRFGFSLSFLKMTPRQDAFPIYAVQSGNGNFVLPGEQRFTKYNLIQAACGMDIAIIKRKKFFAYLGVDVIIGAGAVDYSDNIQTLEENEYSGGGILGGGRFRVGVQYDLSDHFSLMANANRSVFLITEPAAVNWANDYGFGVIYRF